MGVSQISCQSWMSISASLTFKGTGREMLVWGGEAVRGQFPDYIIEDFGDGARYDPATSPASGCR